MEKSLQFEKTSTKSFPCDLLFSRSKPLFNEERSDVNLDLANYGKSLNHSYKTNSVMTFSLLQ